MQRTQIGRKGEVMSIISIEGVAMPIEPIPPRPESSEVRPEESESPEPAPVPVDSGTSVDTYA